MNLNETMFLADIPLPTGRDDPGAGARAQSAGGLDPCAACGRAGADCREAAAAPAEGARAGCGCRARLPGLRRRLPRAMPRRATRRRRRLRRQEGRRQEVSRRRDWRHRCRPQPDIPPCGRRRLQCEVRMPGAPAQAHRRARQSGRRVRAHAAQRGVLVRGRAGAPPWRARSAASRAIRAELARVRIGGERDLAAQADDLHEPQRRADAQRRHLLQGAGRGDPGGARRAGFPARASCG